MHPIHACTGPTHSRSARRRRQRTASLLVSTLMVAGPLAQAAQPVGQTAAQSDTQQPTSRGKHSPAHHAAHQPAPEASPAGAPLTPEEQAAQVLNRFTFGPRPGEVNEVARIGWDAWFEQQLNPASIPDTLLDRRLAQYPALQLSPQQLAVQYPDGQVIRRIADGKGTMPQDPQLAGVYEVLLARYERKQAEDKADAAGVLPPLVGSSAQNQAASGASGANVQGAGVGPASASGPGTSSNSIVPRGGPVPSAKVTAAGASPRPAGVPAGANVAGQQVIQAPLKQQAAAPNQQAATLNPQAAAINPQAAALNPQAAALKLQAAAPLTPEQLEAQKQARKQQEKQQNQAQARMLADQILGYPKNLRMQAIFKLPVEQRMVLTSGITEPEKSMLTNDMNPHEKELFGMMAGGYGGSGVIATELQQAKVLRAVLSERQLQEVMTDFWVNHFNIDLGKSGDELNYASSYERDAIRAHALGKFRDLLLATAEHPAMLIYLDNFQSIGPDSQAAGRPRPNQKNAQQRGLNENYGREVMELHTVGVDGGYTQADVTNLAKILTGWTIDQPQMGGGFLFDPKRHEPGAKQWFGQKIEFQPGPNGINEGIAALNFLAAQPKTAHFISYELAQRFVNDTPPPALVDRMAAAYLGSDGDIKTVLRTMVHSPEFFQRANYRTKVKMPLEYVASSLRATGTDPTNAGALTNELRVMGEPLFRCLPPTGYASTADHWMNSAALVDRLNYALQLTSGRFGGIKFDAPRLLAAGLLNRPGASAPTAITHAVALRSRDDAAPASGQEEALQLMERLLVPGTVSEKTNAVIRQQLQAPEISAVTSSGGQTAGNGSVAPAGSTGMQLATLSAPMPDPTETLDKLAAMILGSPEFQVH